MKPTPQISSSWRSPRHDRDASAIERSFPITNNAYQATAEAVDSRNLVATKSHDLPKLRAFRKISNDFFGAEASFVYAIEAIFFACISAVAAWPITAVIRQLTSWII
jgi:hypothetical protein